MFCDMETGKNIFFVYHGIPKMARLWPLSQYPWEYEGLGKMLTYFSVLKKPQWKELQGQAEGVKIRALEVVLKFEEDAFPQSILDDVGKDIQLAEERLQGAKLLTDKFEANPGLMMQVSGKHSQAIEDPESASSGWKPTESIHVDIDFGNNTMVNEFFNSIVSKTANNLSATVSFNHSGGDIINTDTVRMILSGEPMDIQCLFHQVSARSTAVGAKQTRGRTLHRDDLTVLVSELSACGIDPDFIESSIDVCGETLRGDGWEDGIVTYEVFDMLMTVIRTSCASPPSPIAPRVPQRVGPLAEETGELCS